MTSVLEKAKCLVVKVGSSLVTDRGRGLDLAALSRWAGQIAQLRKQGRRVVLVSSGAMSTRCSSSRVRARWRRNW